MSGRHLVLVGMMGAGKTSVGRRCAIRLRRPFVDTDELVEATTGMRVAEIFESEGEPAFRQLERVAVADAAASPEPLVIACGGGAVLDPESRRALRDSGVVVWLRAAPSVLGDRVRPSGIVRPLIVPVGGATAAETLERIATVRAALYEEVAHVHIDTDDRTVDEVADAVVTAFEQEDGST